MYKYIIRPTVRRSDTWWTVLPKKAAAVAETSTAIFRKIVLSSMNIREGFNKFQDCSSQ